MADEMCLGLAMVIVEGHVDEQSGECSYSAKIGEHETARHETVHQAMAELADLFAHEPEQDRPLALHTAFDQDVIATLKRSTREDFETARAMLPQSAQGNWREAARAYDTAVGDAILAIAAIPPAVRGNLLAGHGLQVEGIVHAEEGAAYAPIVVKRLDEEGEEEAFEFRVAEHGVLQAKDGEEGVRVYNAFVLVPPSQWALFRIAGERIQPACSRRRVLRRYGEIVEGFRQEAKHACKLAPSAMEPEALLAYLAGVLRWMTKHKLDLDSNGLRNPWWALGMSLCGLHGLDSAEAIWAYAHTIFDTMHGIDESLDPTKLTEAEQREIAQTDGSVN